MSVQPNHSSDQERSSEAGRRTPTIRRRTILTCLGLVVAVVAVYGQTLDFKFLNFDDDVHVTENVHVNTGLNASNIIWGFGIHGPSQWHPLAWVSHQLDCSWFGLRPAGHHATSVLLHLASAILLFLTLQRLLNDWGAAVFTSAAFAVHPLNVESVAWISERRNVLCSVFFILTISAYLDYLQHRARIRYLWVVIGHAAALMSKPLAVTLPCVLLLIDLCHPSLCKPGESDSAPRNEWIRATWEKIPLLAMSVASGILTILCQHAVGTVATIDAISLPLRVANAVAAYGWYLWKVIWPFGLGVFYPHPALIAGGNPWSELIAPAAISTAVLLMVTILAMLYRRRASWLLFGWLWYLGVMAPMIGIIQVGEQQQADRYAYLPIIGVFLILGSAGSRLARNRPELRPTIRMAGCLLLLGWGIAASFQVSYWRNSVSLFEQNLAVTERNHLAHNNLGFAFLKQGKFSRAAEQFLLAIKARPNYALAHLNLGVALYELGSWDAARIEFETAVRLNVANPEAHQRLAALLMQAGQFSEAISHFRQAAELAPHDGSAAYNLGLALAKTGNTDEAIQWLVVAHGLRPSHQESVLGLAIALRESGRQSEAIGLLKGFLLNNPGSVQADNLLREMVRSQ